MTPAVLSTEERKLLIALTRIAIKNFDASDWQIMAAESGTSDIVSGHDRLLRSLSFRDPDYDGNAHTVMNAIVSRDHDNLEIIADFVRNRYGDAGESVSTAPGTRLITFRPSVFEVPESGVDANLIAVMTPFSPAFEPVFDAISGAGFLHGFQTQRAKDIWQHSSVIQDVFSLIFRAHIVVCDFTGKNPNVFYEAGIAHTLGKHVIPITQSQADIPFDLQHHRYLHYLNNAEGRTGLVKGLSARFGTLR
ncbi:hypothetical protein [Sphingomonas echinoides]|uniref:hypothetical protein n=1 Tax=Sphingomonas echinoides TaxID=59803 RepID=UPI0024133B71|nr:hypothetical protein [Sphingomonas echinoides]